MHDYDVGPFQEVLKGLIAGARSAKGSAEYTEEVQRFACLFEEDQRGQAAYLDALAKNPENRVDLAVQRVAAVFDFVAEGLLVRIDGIDSLDWYRRPLGRSRPERRSEGRNDRERRSPRRSSSSENTRRTNVCVRATRNACSTTAPLDSASNSTRQGTRSGAAVVVTTRGAAGRSRIQHGESCKTKSNALEREGTQEPRCDARSSSEAIPQSHGLYGQASQR
jgi:hypothetical protein